MKPTSRTFTVYVEPLVGARTNFRNYGDQYSMVVGAAPELPVDAIRHAYLHFLLDTLVLKNRPLEYKKRALLVWRRAHPVCPPKTTTILSP